MTFRRFDSPALCNQLWCCWHFYPRQIIQKPGVQKSFHPTIPNGSTWSKFGARGEHGEHGKDGKHGDVLRFSNWGVLRFLENRSPTEIFSGSPTEMFSGSPTEVFSGSPTEMFSNLGVLRFSENRSPTEMYSGSPTEVSFLSDPGKPGVRSLGPDVRVSLFNKQCLFSHMTLCEVVRWKLSRSVTKILTPFRFKFVGWGLDGQKEEIHSFPTIYIKWGGSLGQNGSKWVKTIMFSKKWSKNSFFEYHDFGPSDFGVGWDPNF